MKALLLEAKQKLKMKEIPTPKISENDVLVKVAYCGICGSDLPRFFEGAVHQFPQILGHEFSGTIEACGSKVTTLAVGDRVAVAPLTVCGHCEYCLAGYPQMCENYGFIGSHQAGAFAEYVAVPEQNIIKVPETVSLKEAALIEPFTVGLHAVERLPIKANDEILVLGAGTIGLMTILALRARGVGNISVSEINDNRLRFAKLAGADQLINPMKTQLEDYVLEHGRPHSVFETAGHPLTQVQAITLARKKGQVTYVGTSHRPIHFEAQEFEHIFRKELIVTGSMMSYSAPFPGYEWQAALSYLERGLIDVKPLITGIVHLEDEGQPFLELTATDSKQIKLLYEIGGEV